MASQGGSVSEARLQDREQLVESLQVGVGLNVDAPALGRRSEVMMNSDQFSCGSA